ncbi:BN860_03136g1_1 [Zygosaccharomyces bailii CLIB 213]|uniref:BN860_03136g1_1 n=1 Tax=Zygosaccharomyces bailii (strain CLIB 213 / ATCC 58445 / CBS 680 / BCRC 21525 / NBRC 1098 / NCYC 1416 / NRRL Y-2227) TaxID=1333698 RepID=A0A8J2T4W5_ZYGB2|nr:BN860_03136g1_1 [Zygosaccharomyces bailii CLIB 213]
MLEPISQSPNGEFVDGQGRVMQLRGVNLDPTVKIPMKPFLPTYNIEEDKIYYGKADEVDFKGHPMPVAELEAHVTRIRSLGYNTVRYLFSWEALEHEGPGKYDFEYMDYAIDFLRRLNEIGGLYVYLDPHQDVWARCCGGSGAPLWTLYCVGLQPSRFESTGAAVLHHHFTRSGKHYPKMLWPTNYFKLACQTMFTLFFGGKDFAPKCIVNNVNIQDYLQDKFISAVMVFYKRIQEKAPELFEHNCILGLETMNEPNNGYLGEKDLGVIPKERSLRRGLTPTALQSFQMGEGLHAHVDRYDLSIFGPSKDGNVRVDPKGTNCWLTPEERKDVDLKYGWSRGEEWAAGQCIWKQHGVWASSPHPRLLKPSYFAQAPNGQVIDDFYFANYYFLEFYKLFRSRFRAIDSDRLLFMQAPVFKRPPELGKHNLLDDKTVCSCHFYDGMSLMFKSWNRLLNVDTFGIMRGKYSNPAFSVVLGEGSVRRCIRKQLKEMVQDVHSAVGPSIPVFFTETGMPFDMNNKSAYQNGDYSSQVAAMDALGFALEGNNLSYSLWCYCHKNSHELGDIWNNEDFSIWCEDDMNLQQRDSNAKAAIESNALTTAPFATQLKIAPINDLPEPPTVKKESLDFSGIRALSALLRPFPIKIEGEFKCAEFHLGAKRYVLEVKGAKPNAQSYVFLPSYHFPLNQLVIDTSSNRLVFDPEYGILKWNHGAGSHYLIAGVESEISKSDDCVIS